MRRESLRTTSPVPASVPPPIASSRTSSPVNGSVLELSGSVLVFVLFVLLRLFDEHNCGLYALHVELLWAKAEAGASNTAKHAATVAIRLINSFR